jgi:acetyl esterase/lipase
MNTPLPLWDRIPGTPDTPIDDQQRARAAEVPTLTPFLLPGDRVRAAVVVCPGGGYGGRAAHEGEPIARWLNSLGLHAFVCDYRVSPWRYPQHLNDAQRALRLVRHHATEWKIDPQRVGILGFSAGGHLVCSVGNFGDDGDAGSSDPVARQSSRADAVVACYPVISSIQYPHAGSFRNLLGEKPDPALLTKLSLETSVTPRNPPTFIWHTADDQAVPVENAYLYAIALRAHKIPHAVHVYPTGRHGLGLAAEHGPVAAWTQACADWLGGIGFRG